MAYTNIDLPTDYFNTITYTGDGSTSRSITGVGFQPDWVWVKGRSTAYYHGLWDAVRTNKSALYSNATDAEDTTTGGTLGSFNSDGFTTPSVSGGFINNSGTTYVAWNWLASNTSGSSNTSGTITSTVSANTTSGFSIVSYTNPASGSPFTVGHGLGVAPKMIIVKTRNVAQTWGVWHTSIGFGNYLRLDSTAATAAANLVTATSSTTFSTYQNHHATSDTLIAYCFADVKGFSKAFSYTGNGSTDGSYVHLGFRPAFVMSKGSSLASSWNIHDDKRQTFNDGSIPYFKANTSDAELSATNMDFLSNGFKLRTADNDWNGSGQTYIGIAFATNPFVSSKGIPACAV